MDAAFGFIPPDARPPADVRILNLHVEPWPDGRRVRVQVELTPFQEKPSLELVITRLDGTEVSSVSLIEVMVFKLMLTMHLRGEPVGASYLLSGRLYYPDLDPVDQQGISFEIQLPEEEPPIG